MSTRFSFSRWLVARGMPACVHINFRVKRRIKEIHFTNLTYTPTLYWYFVTNADLNKGSIMLVSRAPRTCKFVLEGCFAFKNLRSRSTYYYLYNHSTCITHRKNGQSDCYNHGENHRLQLHVHTYGYRWHVSNAACIECGMRRMRNIRRYRFSKLVLI